MLQKVKDWVLLILLAIVGMLSAILLARKPQWVNEKEKEVEKRKETIKEEKKKADQSENEYKEMMKKHDEEIKQTEGKSGKADINSVDDAAHYINDILSNDGS